MSTVREPEITDQQALAQATIAKVRSGLDQGKMPVMGQIVQLIREISEKADQMSVQDLAEVISRDPSTMSRILSIASTMGYNPAGADITSIPQAVTLVGFERIRNLAISVLLLENVDRAEGADVNRELAGLSLGGGLFASSLSRRVSGVEPDLAFLCGALRSYGRMLMSSFLHDDYEKALTNAGRGGGMSDDAFRLQFGLTPLDLGRELLASMQMPPMILNTLRDIPEDIRGKLGSSPVGGLMASAELGLRLAETIASQPVGPEDFESRLAEITREYPKCFALTSEEAGNLMRDVVSQIASFTQAGKFSKGKVVLFQRMDCLSEGRQPPPPFKPKVRKPSADNAGHSSATQSPTTRPPLDAKRASSILEVARKELAVLLAAPRPDLRQAFALLIQGLQNALELQSCLVFLQEPAGRGFQMEHGIGRLAHEVGGGTVLRSGQRDVFAVPLGRGEDVMIQNPLEARMKAFIPEWLRPAGEPLPFVLLPLKDELGTYGLICGNTSCPSTLAVAGEIHEDLRLLRAELSRLGRQIRARQP